MKVFQQIFAIPMRSTNTQNSRLGNNYIGQEVYNYHNIRTCILLTIIQPGPNSVFSILIVLKGIIVISYSKK